MAVVHFGHSPSLPCTLKSHLLDHRTGMKCSSDFTPTVDEAQGKEDFCPNFMFHLSLSIKFLLFYQNNSLGFRHPNHQRVRGQPSIKAHSKASNRDDTRRLPHLGQVQGHAWNSLIFLQLRKRHSVFSIALRNKSCQHQMRCSLWDKEVLVTKPVNIKGRGNYQLWGT